MKDSIILPMIKQNNKQDLRIWPSAARLAEGKPRRGHFPGVSRGVFQARQDKPEENNEEIGQKPPLGSGFAGPVERQRVSPGKILFTGGSGLLGGEMKKLIPRALFPSSKVFNLTNYRQMEKYLVKKKPEIVIHAAAFTSPALIEEQPEKALWVNLIGTAYLTDLCFRYGMKMVYICTDYVYKGDKGNYTEEDPVLPQNKYGWSKLGGECAVRLLDNSLILRIAMGEKVFPHPRAFIDHITSRETVDVIAKKIIQVVNSGARGVFNLGTKGRSVYAFAKSLKGKRPIGKISIKAVNFTVPHNTSFNTSKFEKLIRGK